MIPPFLTIAKYEIRQYRRSYFEQFFVFAGIILMFLLVSKTSQGTTLDTPSSWGMYRVGYVQGSGFSGFAHYSVSLVAFLTSESAVAALDLNEIDVFAQVIDDEVVFRQSGSERSLSALKRLRQIMVGQKRDRIYALADNNSSLDGILLPIKIKALDSNIDYSAATDPEVSLHRLRFIERLGDENKVPDVGVNLLNIDEVRRMNLTQALLENASQDATDDIDRSGFTLPEEWEIPFVFKNIYNNIAVVSVSILLSILLSLSLAREKVNNTIILLYQTPINKVDILAGKALPYLALMWAVDLGYSVTQVAGLDALKVFYIFAVLSVTLASFAMFTVLASKNYREMTFMSSLLLMSFLMFIVIPNIFSGINVLAFLSPLDTITSLQNGASVGAIDVFLSLLPYKFLCAFFLATTLVCFSPETFQNTPGILGMIRLFYGSLPGYVGGGIVYAMVSVSLLVPFIFIVQTVLAYLIMPLGYMAPVLTIFLLAALEELVKILPYHYNKRLNPLAFGLISGASFFLTEKLFNIYLISKVYSFLPAPYTVFVIKGLISTFVLHVSATSVFAVILWLFATLLPKSKSRMPLWLGLFTVTVMHYLYNMYMMGWPGVHLH